MTSEVASFGTEATVERKRSAQDFFSPALELEKSSRDLGRLGSTVPGNLAQRSFLRETKSSNCFSIWKETERDLQMDRDHAM